MIHLGILGTGRIAKRFMGEIPFVPGIQPVGVYNPNLCSAKGFAQTNGIPFFTGDLPSLFSKAEAVYIATPHETHFSYIMEALRAGCHVLCEKPLCLSKSEAQEAFEFAQAKNLLLLEALKTAYCPGFLHLIRTACDGTVGAVWDVEASCTMLRSGSLRELDPARAGGSMNELASYTLLPIIKLLGTDYSGISFYSKNENGVDMFTRASLSCPRGSASMKVGLGVKSEGNCVVSGTKGYLLCPSPWWKTGYFEARFEDPAIVRPFTDEFEGDGLRYELAEFVRLIRQHKLQSECLTPEESIFLADVIERFHARNGKSE